MTVKMKDTQPSMKDLLTHVKDPIEFQEGETIKGVVLFVSKNEVIVDVPNVGLGVVRGKELYNEEYLSGIKVDDEVEAILLDLDNERGMIELSFRAIGRDKIWTDVKNVFENEITVDAKIRDANRGGFLVRVQGVDGFLPASLLSPMHAVKQTGIEDKSLLNQMKKYVGQNFKVKVISINEDADTLIVSEKAVSDELAKEKLSKYKVGDIIEGTVVGAVDFGIFVRFDEDLEGLVHISEIAWKKVDDPRIEYKLGQKFKAKIVEIDNENRINLSIKQLLPNPWVDFASKTKEGDKFVGTVSKIVAYGAIIVNDDDIQGLCHITQMSEEKIENPSQIHGILKIGESKEFTVLGVDVDEKLYLTLLDFKKAKQVQEDLIKQSEELSNTKEG
ncbi:S1 RNA-binding domain-containing protein [Candidatus Gracilibacteria bacterium]|nr:S1 RNA-binding domain-containing protein [Candidatus Gracilibacteria bacterium]NJS41407.1 S1 RNA-binding domain-containing protein [Candidatus Gracilibacteria bacterium]